MGVHVANFMDHGSSKTPAGLGSNTTGLGTTQITLLEYHMQECIGHALYAGCCLVGERHNSLGRFHLACIQSAIWRSSIFTNA